MATKRNRYEVAPLPDGWRGAVLQFTGAKDWLSGTIAKLTDSWFASWFGGSSSYAGVNVNEGLAQSIATVATCDRVLSQTIGMLPWHVYERQRNGNLVRVDHDVGAVLIDSPNAEMTSQEMREAVMSNLNMRGNAFSIITRAPSGRLVSVYPVRSQDARLERLSNGDVVAWINDRGREEKYPLEKIWHVKGWGNSGLEGFSPLTYARHTLGMAVVTERFGSEFFANGAQSTGIVSAKDWLTDAQRDRMKKILAEQAQGLTSAHKWQLLEGGTNYQAVNMPLEDAQFLQLRKYTRREIFGLFGLPPHMGGDVEDAHFNNVEGLGQYFVTYTLQPFFSRFEQTASKRLFTPAERGRFVLRFNAEGLLRGDSAARAGLYSILLQNGVLTRNEVRALENRPTSDADGMDDHTVQSNMTLVQLLEQIAKAQAQPKAPPAALPPAAPKPSE